MYWLSFELLDDASAALAVVALLALPEILVALRVLVLGLYLKAESV